FTINVRGIQYLHRIRERRNTLLDGFPTDRGGGNERQPASVPQLQAGRSCADVRFGLERIPTGRSEYSVTGYSLPAVSAERVSRLRLRVGFGMELRGRCQDAVSEWQLYRECCR